MARPFVKFELVGARDLARNLRELPEHLQKGAIRRGLLKVGQPIADDAEQRLDAVRLKPRIAVASQLSKRQRAGQRREKGVTTVYIGVRPSSLAHLIEFGTTDRYTTGGGDGRGKRGRQARALGMGGAYRGKMPANPFLRPAWDGGKDKALNDFGRILGAEIEATAKRLAKRNAKARR